MAGPSHTGHGEESLPGLLLFTLFLKTGFLWLSWNSLYRLGWPPVHREAPAFALPGLLKSERLGIAIGSVDHTNKRCLLTLAQPRCLSSLHDYIFLLTFLCQQLMYRLPCELNGILHSDPQKRGQRDSGYFSLVIFLTLLRRHCYPLYRWEKRKHVNTM